MALAHVLYELFTMLMEGLGGILIELLIGCSMSPRIVLARLEVISGGCCPELF